MKNLAYFASLLCIASSPSLANKLSADLNQDSFHIQGDATHASNGLIYSGQLLLTADQGTAAAVTMRTNGQVANNSYLGGGLGGKLYLLDDEANTYAAIGIGGRLEYRLPALKGVTLSGELYYAPNIVISGDANSIVDFNLRISYDIFDNSALYLGARNLEADYEGGEHEFDAGPHAGIQIDF